MMLGFIPAYLKEKDITANVSRNIHKQVDSRVSASRH